MCFAASVATKKQDCGHEALHVAASWDGRTHTGTAVLPLTETQLAAFDGLTAPTLKGSIWFQVWMKLKNKNRHTLTSSQLSLSGRMALTTAWTPTGGRAGSQNQLRQNNQQNGAHLSAHLQLRISALQVKGAKRLTPHKTGQNTLRPSWTFFVQGVIVSSDFVLSQVVQFNL